MKSHTKIVLLVAMTLFLTLTACTRQASKPPVALPTNTGEAPFPLTTPGGVNVFGTQTAEAMNPQAVGLLTTTPQVILSTGTPEPGADQTGGGQVVTATPAPSGGGPATGDQSGGGVAAPAANNPVNTPVITTPNTYTLQKGEWPICIARRYGLDIGALLSANGLNMNSKPGAGTTMTLPTGSAWNNAYGSRALKAHPTSYTVGSGDSVYSIACNFGDVAPESILAVNGLSSPSDLKAGTTIRIP
jgi:LysM repeat protein